MRLGGLTLTFRLQFAEMRALVAASSRKAEFYRRSMDEALQLADYYRALAERTHATTRNDEELQAVAPEPEPEHAADPEAALCRDMKAHLQHSAPALSQEDVANVVEHVFN